jgi:WD40 repeat protein
METGQSLCTLEGNTNEVNAVAVAADGRRSASGSEDCTLRLWDLENGEEIATFTGESGMDSCAIAPDGRTIVAGESSGRVHFLRLVEADKTKSSIGDTKDPTPAPQGTRKLDLTDS